MPAVKTYNFTLTDIDGSYDLAHSLAQFFPQPDHYLTAIFELLLNAVEHGNLGIGYELKSKLLCEGRWSEELERRKSLAENCGKRVAITVAQDKDCCCLSIEDQGNGFAWKDFVDSFTSGKRPNGRGLLIAFNSRFDSIRFNEAGNKVTCVVNYR